MNNELCLKRWRNDRENDSQLIIGEYDWKTWISTNRMVNFEKRNWKVKIVKGILEYIETKRGDEGSGR